MPSRTTSNSPSTGVPSPGWTRASAPAARTASALHLAARLAGHGRVGRHGQLHGELADAAGRPGDQDPVGVGPGQAQDAGRGHPGHGQGGGGHGNRRPAAAPSTRPGRPPVRRAAAPGDSATTRSRCRTGSPCPGRPPSGHVPADDRARRLLGRRPDLAPVDRGRLHVEQELAGAGDGSGTSARDRAGEAAGSATSARMAKPTTPLRPSIRRPDLPINGRRGGDEVHEAVVGHDPAGTAVALNGQLPEAAHPWSSSGRCLLTVGDGGFGGPGA